MPFNTFERLVAFRYLRSRRQEGFISVIAIFSLLGIMLGVATLIIVMAVMNGFRAELLNEILGIDGHLRVKSSAPGGKLPDFDKLIAEIKTVPGVVTVRPLVEGQILATANGTSTGAIIRGMRESDLAEQPMLTRHIAPAVLQAFSGDNVIVGSQLATTLGLHAGDSVTVLSPNGQATAFGNVPRVKTYHVAGTFDVGMFQYDSAYIFSPFDTAQLYFQAPAAATDLEVFVDDPDHTRQVGFAIYNKLGDKTRIYDWQQRFSGILGAVQIERDVMFIILSLIVLVAAFNIISSMIMLVKDKGRAIAILRTMGATRGMILRIFILSGASIGIVGTITGFIVGVEFTNNIEGIRQFLQNVLQIKLFDPEIYFFTRIPAKIEWSEVASVLIMAFGLSFLATLYPSWRAARLDPVEALRYE
jgi:lipoprotein-releasing system permease protein